MCEFCAKMYLRLSLCALRKELLSFLVDVAKAGYGKTRKQIVGLAESVACDKGRMTGQKKISHGWFRKFMNRQLQLSLRKGDPTANVRMDCLTKETMDKYRISSIKRRGYYFFPSAETSGDYSRAATARGQ